MLDWIKLLVLPPAGPLLLSLGGCLLLGAGRRWGRWPLWIGLLLAILLSTEAVVDPLANRYANAAPAQQTLRLAQAWAGRSDAIVLVLGGGIRDGAGADGGHDLKPLTAERLRRGLWWSRHLSLPLAFSGGVPPRAEPGSPSEATVVARAMQEAGAPNPLWLDHEAKNTLGNASHSATHVQRLGTRKLILVTHAVHMPRALAHFKRALPNIEILPAPLHREPMPGWALSDFLPSAEGAGRGAYLCYEWAAQLAGR